MPLPGSPGPYVGNALTKQRADVFIPELWTGEVKRARDQRLIASRYTKRIASLGRQGDKIHIPNISRASVNDKLPETPVTLQARTESEFSMEITDYKETSHMIEDVVGIQKAEAYDIRGEITRESGYALARDIDASVLAHRAVIHNRAAQVLYSSSNGAVNGNGLPISYSILLAATLLLDDADVPEEDRVLIVSPGQYMQLLNLAEFKSSDFVSYRGVETGRVGEILGIPVVKTSMVRINALTNFYNGDPQFVPGEPGPGVVGSRYLPKQDTFTALPQTFTGDSRPVVTALMAHRDWLAVAMPLEPTVEWSRENMYQADALVMTMMNGYKVFRDNHAVVIHTVNTIT